MYRLKDGRFEQIGISWVKHGFGALAGPDCCPVCQNPGDFDSLGPGFPEDLDGDGSVAFADLTDLLSRWGPC